MANRFFHALSLMYAAGVHRVEKMVTIAARAIGNSTLRADMLLVAKRIEQGGSLPDSFEHACYLSRAQKNWSAGGDLAGTLEASFDRLATDAGESLQVRLAILQQVVFRVMLFAVVGSIALTLISLTRFI